MHQITLILVAHCQLQAINKYTDNRAYVPLFSEMIEGRKWAGFHWPPDGAWSMFAYTEPFVDNRSERVDKHHH